MLLWLLASVDEHGVAKGKPDIPRVSLNSPKSLSVQQNHPLAAVQALCCADDTTTGLAERSELFGLPTLDMAPTTWRPAGQ